MNEDIQKQISTNMRNRESSCTYFDMTTQDWDPESLDWGVQCSKHCYTVNP